MNLPNLLTLGRLGITLLLVMCLSVSFLGKYLVALVLFIVATVTDYYDGALARRRGLVTDFGKLMDPLADKILIASAFICLIPAIPAWVVILIIAREFLITGLRLLASSQNVIMPAERLGKHKTGWQMATVISYLLFYGIMQIWYGLGLERFWIFSGEEVERYFFQALDWISFGILTVTVVLTLYSGVAYFWKNRSLIRTK